ncbi:MAG: hypothetical protein RLZZ297_660, partial [Chloroflexota bacterium]
MHLSRTWLYRALLGLFAVAALGVGLVRYTRSVTAVERLAEVQETARLSGGYAFETEIDSIRDYEPSIANYGRESVHTQLVITGSVDESAQTSQITIRNAQGIVMQIKRAQGRTYVRQAGSDWQQSTAATATSQLNTLTYLSGVVAAEAVAGDHAGYHYTFDGGAFVEHFRRLLKADSVAGINYRDEWTAIARSAQLRALHGQGTVTVDRDGLPTTMELQLVQPADAQNGAVKSVIRTTFTNYARTGLGLRQLTNQPLRLLSKVLPVSVDQLEWALYVLGVVVALAAVVTILLRAGRLVRVPGTVLMIGILLHQPYASLRPEPTVASAAERRVEQTPTPPPLPAGFDPTRSPLDAGMPVALTGGVSVHPATNTTAATNRGRVSGRSGDTSDTSDSDGDGMTDGQERLYGSNPSRADSDNDGLTDPQEQQVGTKPTIADSDADGMNDGVETKNPTRIGSNTFYTSPLSPDTNGDGFSDSLECPLKIMDAGANCQDSDSDGMPDTLDFDDDNDAIVDRIDESPTARATTTYTEASPLPLRILGTATTPKPLTVDLQIRPTDEKLLYAQNAVYDWPSNDTEGQIERTKQTTFASSLLYNARDTNAANGDVRVSAMLEVRIPVSENTSNTGFLPVKACAATNSCPANEVAPRWLDTDKLRGYGITGGWGYGADGRRGTTEVVLTIPLSPVTDASGSNVGYSAHMYYETSATPWASAHNYRMLWTVSMLADRCPAETPSCTASEREEYATVLQSYYSNFTLTGLTATEQNGTTAALVSEDSKSTQVTDTTKRRLWYTQLYQLFSAGFVDNATLKIRDTDANISIETLFDSTRNGSARTESNYGIPKSVSRVAVATYASHENLVNVNAGLLPTVLNDALCRAANLANGCATAPALRTACEAQTTVACRPGVMLLTDASTRRKGFTGTPTIDFSGTTPTSVRSVTGTIYKVKAGGWVPIETSDAEYELPSIIANVRAATPPASVTAAQWQTYAEALATALYWATAQTKTQAWTQAALTNASNPTYTALAATFNDTWSGQVAAIMDRWSGFIEVQIANKERMEALVDVVSVSTSSTLSAISTVVDAVERVRELNAGATTGVRIRNGAGALFVVVAAAAGFAMLIYSSLGRGGLAGSSEEAIERLKQFDLAVKIG